MQAVPRMDGEDRLLYYWAVDVFSHPYRTYYCISRSEFDVEYGSMFVQNHVDMHEPFGLRDIARKLQYYEGYAHRNLVHPQYKTLDAGDVLAPMFEFMANLDGIGFVRRNLNGRELRELRSYMGLPELKKVS